MNQERMILKGQLHESNAKKHLMETEIKGLILSLRNDLRTHQPDLTMLNADMIKINTERLYELLTGLKTLSQQIAEMEADLE